MSRAFFPRFDAELEGRFQESYYARIQPILRVITLLLAVMFLAYAARDYLDTQSIALSATQNGTPALFFLLIFALTWVKGFERVWQWAILGGGLIAAIISFNGQASFIAAFRPDSVEGAGPFSADSLFFGQQVRLVVVCLALMRLQFRWALALQIGALSSGVWVFAYYLLNGDPVVEISRFLQSTAAVFIAVLMAAAIEEQLASKAFYANYLLDFLQKSND